jgi:hypothetical protein
MWGLHASRQGRGAACFMPLHLCRKTSHLKLFALPNPPATVLQGGAEPSSFPEPLTAAGASKAPRRVVPEAMGAAPGDAAGASKAPRRIVAEAVCPAPSSAAKSSLPAESAASGKAAKRITPTPLRTAAVQAVSQQFAGSTHQQQQPASVQPATSEMSRDGQPPASARRITPVLVGAAVALPPGEERTASVSVAAAPLVAVPKGGIAALAAAMGARAAQARKKD